MSLAVCLVLCGSVTALLAPALLARAVGAERSPRLGLIAWMGVIGAVTAAWAAALVLVIVDALRDLTRPGCPSLGDTCVTRLHDTVVGGYGAAVEGGLLLVGVVTTVTALVTAGRLIRMLVRARRITHEHARMVRIAGRYNAFLDAVVLDVAEPAAYCVAGKEGTVVVTRGTIAALDEDHLAAVLAHERAHLAGRHHLLLGTTRGLATVFPRIRLFTRGAVEVARLAEMCADDAAARIHGPRTVIRALLALSGVAADAAGPIEATGAWLPDRVDRLVLAACPVPFARDPLRHPALSVATIGSAIATVLAAASIAVCAPGQVSPAHAPRPMSARAAHLPAVPTLLR